MDKKIEILAGNMDNYFSRTGIKGKKTWEGSGTYQVWELSQEEFKKLLATEDASYQNEEWWRSAEGSNMGIVHRRFKINHHYIKAWDGASREEQEEENKQLPVDDRFSTPREYRSLTEYLCDEIGSSQPRNVCALCTDLAKQNSMTMAELFSKYEGRASKYYLCDCCKDTVEPNDEAIFNCNKCGKQICNVCVVNIEEGELIPCDDQRNIDPKYCPFCGNTFGIPGEGGIT